MIMDRDHIQAEKPVSPLSTGSSDASPAQAINSSISSASTSSSPTSSSPNIHDTNAPSCAMVQRFEQKIYGQQIPDSRLFYGQSTSGVRAGHIPEFGIVRGGAGGDAARSILNAEEYVGKTVAAPSRQPHADHRKTRACESCRSLKVRCELAESNPNGPCKRCTKAGRECLFTIPSRKRAKKTDTKMAEMERQLKMLSEKMNEMEAKKEIKENEDGETGNLGGEANREDDGNDDEDHSMEDKSKDEQSVCHSPKTPRRSNDASQGNSHGRQSSEREQPPTKRHKTGEESDPEIRAPSVSTTTFLAPKGTRTSNSNSDEERTGHACVYLDVIERELITMEAASDLFERYTKDMAPRFPAVVFPEGHTATELRKEKPMLFLAILSVASGISSPTLHKELNRELLKSIADKVVRHGEKSLELVQAILVAALWYYPPANLDQLNFYQLMHMAAVMALDIGMGKRPGNARCRAGEAFRRSDNIMSCGAGSLKLCVPPPGTPGEKPCANGVAKGCDGWRKRTSFPDSSSIESRRTLLGCYFICASASMSLRRPNLLRFSTFMQECMDVLATSKDALPTDRELVEWCKVAKIAEEIGATFAFDDPSANISIHDIRIQLNMKGFARQLEHWKADVGKLLTRDLDLAYNFVLVYAHEVAMHVDHNIDDFRPPYIQTSVVEPALKPTALLSMAHLDALSRCLTHAHATLEIFLSRSIHEVRSMPAFQFVRTIYAIVVLMKLYYSASIPSSELGKVMDKDTLQVPHFVCKLLGHLTKAAEGDKCRLAGKFKIILTMLKTWWISQRIEMGELDPRVAATSNPQLVECGTPKPHTPSVNGTTMGLHGRTGSDVAGATSSFPYTPMDSSSYNSPDQQRKPYTRPETPLSFESLIPTLRTDRSCRGDDSDYEPGRVLPHNQPPSTPLHILSDVASEVQESVRHGYGSNQPMKYDVNAMKTMSGTTPYDQIANDGRYPSASLPGGMRIMPSIYSTSGGALPMSSMNGQMEGIYGTATGVSATTAPTGSYTYAVSGDNPGMAKQDEAGGSQAAAISGGPEGGLSMIAGFSGSTQDLGLGPDWMVDDTFWAVMDGMPTFDAWDGMTW